MSRIIKILSTPEVAIDILGGTPTTVSSAKLVRVVNTHATATRLLTIKADGAGDAIATITILAQTEIYIKKETTDTLEESGDASDVLAVEIAFT